MSDPSESPSRLTSGRIALGTIAYRLRRELRLAIARDHLWEEPAESVFRLRESLAHSAEDLQDGGFVRESATLTSLHAGRADAAEEAARDVLHALQLFDAWAVEAALLDREEARRTFRLKDMLAELQRADSDWADKETSELTRMLFDLYRSRGIPPGLVNRILVHSERWMARTSERWKEAFQSEVRSLHAHEPAAPPAFDWSRVFRSFSANSHASVFVPGPLQLAILKALEGRALRKQALANIVCKGEGSRLYRPNGIKELLSRGLVAKSPAGFFRPDAPPPDADITRKVPQLSPK